MALVHNMLIRSYNSIYLQATHVRTEDVVDFLHYCAAWHIMLKGHHDAEEEVYFPGLEEATGVKGVMDSEVHEHGQHPLKSALMFCPASSYFTVQTSKMFCLADPKAPWPCLLS